MWITAHDDFKPGDLVFLVEVTYRGVARTVGQVRPGRTNISGEPKLRGWLGETNNVDRHAVGAGRVVRQSVKFDERYLVKRLADNDVTTIETMAEAG